MIRANSILHLLLSSIALVIAGCSAGSNSDSALGADSVAFDVHAAKVPVVSIELASKPLWTTGGFKSDPDSEVSNQGGVMGLVALPGDRYLLSEGSRVRVFDGDGNETWRFGREGAGPQEFHGLGWPCRVDGDTVVVMDQRNQRFAVILADSGVLRTIPSQQRSLREGACSGDGLFVTQSTVRDTSGDGGRDQYELWDARGDSVGTVAEGPMASYSIVGSGWPSWGMIDSLVYVADPNSGTITLFTRTGGTVVTLVWGASRVPVTNDNIPDRYGIVPGGASGADLDAWWDQVRSKPRTKNWPAFVQVRADGHGRFWILEALPQGGDNPDWYVVSGTGKVLAEVALPRFTREQRVWTVGFTPRGIAFYHEDADGAPWVGVYGYPEALKGK